MLKKIKLIIILAIIIIVLGGGAWFFGTHTIVKTDKEYVLLEKESFHFQHAYLDTREWSISDYADHPEILKGLIAKGYDELKENLKQSELGEKIKKLGETLKEITQ